VLLAVALVAGACGGSDGDAAAHGATGRFGAIHTEVCQAAAQAGDGDLTAARRRFDDVHQGLHDLAAAAEEADRTAAAELLRAKQRVEADLTKATLDGLVGPVADAVEATGGTAPATCP
jgi:hypothetical protein